MDLFRHQHVRLLRRDHAGNLQRYTEKKPWANKPAFAGDGNFSCSLEPSVPLVLQLPDGEDRKDFDNAVLIHRAFPTLTPLQARDPRLWTRFTHVECWSYMQKRWNVSRHMENPSRAARFVMAHYFVPRAESRALLRNGIARLWWYAHLTHNPERAEPYELTKVLLSYLDIAQQLLERNMGRAKELRTGFLDVLRLHDEQLGASAGQKRDKIRALAKSLNLRGGVTILDTLTHEDVTKALQLELGLDVA